MPVLQIRDLPEATYRKLVDCARREHRSLSQQATVLLANALKDAMPPRDRRRFLLKDLAERPITRNPENLPAPEQIIREDRER